MDSLGGRYGPIEPESGKGYIHLEYEYALGKGKPFCSLVISEAYLQERGEEITFVRAYEQANPEKYKQFKAMVTQKLYRPFNDKKDIQSAILHKLPDWAQREDLAGWVRAEDAVSPELANELARLSTENRELRERVKAFESNTEVAFDKIILDTALGAGSGLSKPEQLAYLSRA